MKSILKFIWTVIKFPFLLLEVIIKFLFLSVITFFVIVAILIGIKTREKNNTI
jgi:hypothetical protein